MTAGFRRSSADAEVLAAAALLALAAAVGPATAGDYGISVDEFNADDYGPKALAWYLSGFTNRSWLETVEETLWFYGPWFQIATTLVQSSDLIDHWTVRHALTFLVGLAGIAALLPMARLGVGRWAGLIAIGLCLTTGYLYGSLFFSPIDVPFLFAMTWSTFAIMVMARCVVPSWPATIAAGLLTGLAIATRASGIITHIYLVGAMVLCGIEAVLTQGSPTRALGQILARTVIAMLIAWAIAIALWPWLQIANPLTQFIEAFVYFANHPNSFEFQHWGRDVTTTELPWSYVPAQLAARLPEAFLLLLVLGLVFGLVNAFRTLRAASQGLGQPTARAKAITLAVARARPALVIWAAAVLPLAAVIVQGSTLYDGIRHVLFLIPILALIAAYGLLQLSPLLRRFPLLAAAGGAAYAAYLVATLIILHPLQYVAMNSLAGGVSGAYGRFELDYWSIAANTALRRLERRLDPDRDGRFAASPPTLMICIGHREGLVEPMFRLPWRLEVDAKTADFVIETERSRCAEGLPARLIDEVKRFGRTFAWVYVRQPAPDGSAAAADPH
jgi:hypothetical protein